MSGPSDFLVLVVDDHGPNRYVKKHILARHGYRVIEAESGLGGLEVIRDARPDLVLLDVRLPDVSGIEVCRTIKADDQLHGIMVLQTSAVSISTPDKVGALDAGADGYLAEPAEPEELLAVVRSLLRLRQAERDLREARGRTLAAMADKSRFLAMASHDLRQPLQAANLFVSLLERRLGDPAMLGLLAHVSESLRGADGLLNALMTISSLDTATHLPEVGVVDLMALLTRLDGEHRSAAEEKGLGLTLRPKAVSVRSDPVMLERILRNLIGNAIRYTERGRILVGVRARGDHVRIEVHDTGIGIPEQCTETIFEDFFQVGNTARSRGEGNGLGLSIVRRMATVLDHPLTLRTREGHGSCFAIDVPLATDAEAMGPTTASGALRPGRVLVVEDDLLQAQALRTILEDMGCEVVVAHDAEGALAIIPAGSDFQAAISDYRLPRMSGVECLNALRQRGVRFRHGVVQTGDTDVMVRDLVETAGYQLLHKPYDVGRLASVLAMESGRAG